MNDQKMTIAEFQSLIRDRYHDTDAARGVAPTFLWFAEEFGELAEACCASILQSSSAKQNIL